MENGAKALLIAGAILISVILMTVGVYVISTTSKSSEQLQTDMKTTSADVFNSKISQYFGNEVSGSRVKTMLSTIMYNNQNSDHLVYVDGYNILRKQCYT